MTHNTEPKTIIELLRDKVDKLEQALSKTQRHACQFCVRYDCGRYCQCFCGCISQERRLHLEELRYLLECAETGETPQLEEGNGTDDKAEPGDGANGPVAN